MEQFVVFKMSDKSEHSNSKCSILARCPNAEESIKEFIIHKKHHKENKGCNTVHPYSKTFLFLLVYKFHQQGQQTWAHLAGGVTAG